jgi:predicted dehydrogenase
MSADDRIRVGVVGVGVMGSYHANVYAALPGVALAGIVDPDSIRRAVICDDLSVAGFSSHADLIGRTDAVSIAAPTSVHYQIARDLIEAGIHVMIEKPIATTVEEAEDLAERARRRGVVLQVGHIMRFYPAVRDLPRLVRDPVFIEARRIGSARRIVDVGVTLDLMIHDIDLILSVVRSPLLHAQAQGVAVTGPHEDLAHAQLRFQNGCLASLTASRISPFNERSLQFTRAGEAIRLDFTNEPSTEVSAFRAGPAGSEGGPVTVERFMVHNDNPLRGELRHFIDRIRLNQPPIGTVDDDLRALRVALQLRAGMHLEVRPASPEVAHGVR